MAQAVQLDLKEIIDEQRITRSTMLLYLVALLVMVSDGFDVAVIGYLAPELVKEWGVSSESLVPAFSVGIIGAMVGGIVMGAFGDRVGRKRLLIIGLIAMGVGTLATIFVRNGTDLIAARLLTGLGIGGVMPNILALVAESTPQRVRGRAIITVTLGILPGIALAGIAAATLIPLLGWRAILLVGGVLPLIVAFASRYLVRESLEYVVRKGGREAEVRAIVARMRPDLPITQESVIAVPEQGDKRMRGSPRALFAGPLMLVTPLIWICFAIGQLANYFALTWLPTLLQSIGWSITESGLLASAFSAGGLAGGLLLLFIVDKKGLIALVAMYLIGTPLFAVMLSTQLPYWATIVCIAGAGFCVGGINFGIGALPAILYPGAIRSIGVGGGYAAGRIGALAAPALGGALLAANLDVQDLMLRPAMLLGAGALCCIALALVCMRNLGGVALREIPLTTDGGSGRAGHAAGVDQSIANVGENR